MSPLSLLVAAVVVVLVGVFFFSSSPPAVSSDVPPSSSIQGCVDVNRSSYGVSPSVFSHLVSPPACFYSVVREFQSGGGDSFFFTEPFYTQPEFIPGFVSTGLDSWKDPVPSHYGVVGFGAFPHYSKVRLGSDSNVSVRFFMHAGFGVRSAQRVHLRVSPSLADGNDALSFSLDPESSAGFVLGPSFPLFEPEWVHPVELRVSTGSVPLSNIHTFEVWTEPGPAVDGEELFSAVYPLVDSTDFVGPRLVYTLYVSPA